MISATLQLRRNWPAAVLFAYTILFFAFILAPIVIVVVVSFASEAYVAFPISGWSLRWYHRIVEYQPFVDSFVLAIQIAVLSSALGALLGVPAALLLARSRSRAAYLTMTFLLSPLSMPGIVLGFALLFYLSKLGLGVSFLSLLIGHTVVSLPYIVRTVAGVYRNTPPSLEETAMVLGANKWNVFWHVTLPMIRPGIFAGCLFAMLLSFDNLPISLFFASPSTSTLPVVVLSYLEYNFDPAVASISAVQLAFAIVVLVVIERFYGLRSFSPTT